MNEVIPWLDKAGSIEVEHLGGIPHWNEDVYLWAPRTGVLHTTEGAWAGSLAVFRQHWAPHFLVGMDPAVGRVRVAQLVQIGTIGAALEHNNAYAIVQVEVVASSKQTPWIFDDETAEAVAGLMAACKVQYGIPISRPWQDGDYGVYGNNPHRASGHFTRIAGWYGHGDVPMPDVHWDPGSLMWSHLFARADAMLAASPPAPWTAPALPPHPCAAPPVTPTA